MEELRAQMRLLSEQLQALEMKANTVVSEIVTATNAYENVRLLANTALHQLEAATATEEECDCWQCTG